MLLVLAAAAQAKHAKAGVCYTRNQVRYDMSRADYGTDATQWKQVSTSVRSLRTFNPELATCLFTEAPHRVVNHVMKNGSLFDVVETQPDLDDVLESIDLADQWRRLVALVPKREARHSDSLLDMMASRLKRIHNYGRAPFDTTLFVDDDTVFCPDRHLSSRLRGFAGADVRFVEMGLSKPDRSRLVVEQDRLGRCGDNWTCAYSSHQRCEWFQESEKGPSLQGGAVLVKRGAKARSFARAWMVEYLELWTNALASANVTHMRIGTDQKPLDRIVKRACDDPDAAPFEVGALPPNFNARFLTTKWTGLVAGPVVVLHSHLYGTWGPQPDFFHRIGALCATLNKHSRPRFISVNVSLSGQSSSHDLAAAVQLEDIL